MASTYLTRTNSSPTNAKKYTWSSWNKIDSLNWYPFFSTTHQGGHSYIGFGASSSKHFGVIEHGDSAGTLYQVATSSVQADSTGWYHVVVQFDSTQSTASDRLKIYINNVLQTSFVSNNYPSQNLDSWFVDATTIEIGRRSQGSGQYYSGLISHAHFIDGTVYAPSTFGEIDSTTGEWKIKTDPAISTANYGNNGFWMFKDNNSLNDNSGNGNNFTVGGGTLTKTEDNPSNVFATVNSLDSFYQNTTLSEGNLKIAFNDGYAFNSGTLGFNSGKYYWEVRSNNWSAGNQAFGVTSALADATNDEFYNNTGSGTGYGYYNNGYVYGNGGNFGQNWVNSGYGLIGMIAVDADNNKLYFGANGTWGNSANPSTGANGISIVATSTQSTGLWFPAFSGGASSAGNDFKINFGNGYFGTTAVASAGTNASNNGIFEYDVPTGFTALSTKGLNL